MMVVVVIVVIGLGMMMMMIMMTMLLMMLLLLLMMMMTLSAHDDALPGDHRAVLLLRARRVRDPRLQPDWEEDLRCTRPPGTVQKHRVCVAPCLSRQCI
jgi:hypothetical protein